MNKLKLNVEELTVDAFQTVEEQDTFLHAQFVVTKPILDCSAGSCGHICP
ncbi:MAG TPA: hypothetical protein VFE05_20070 [Longimicrobiaceae bacterium]|jgi:hypothetical protein|nr:hypothetical protein [Longimicrobiaceae bacterium]